MVRFAVRVLFVATGAVVTVVMGVGPIASDALPAGDVGAQQSLVAQHFEYVFPDGKMVVYDIDHDHQIVETASLPTKSGVRGVAASPLTHTLYVSYGGDGGPHGAGSILAYDLVGRKIVWVRNLRHGIDSFALSQDGRRIYLPDGELASDGFWYVLDAQSGRQLGRIVGGAGAHNTVVGATGAFVYLGGRDHNYLEVASVRSNRVVKRVGPLKSGVRPFTVNGRESLAFTTATSFLGFQVSDLRAGNVLYTKTFKGFTWNPDTFAPSAPSHGISLSPDEKELYVLDAPNSYVHVFDVSGLPQRSPQQVADIKVSAVAGTETACAYDCLKDGWLQHSRDGRFVYVGDSGDVIDTATRRPIAHLDALRNSRKMLEIDWQDGVPTSTTSRIGIGYVK